MKLQMMRVISSPSSSTIGFTTLIFGIGRSPSRAGMARRAESNAPEIAGNIAPRHGRATLLFGRAAGRRCALNEVAESPEIRRVEVRNGPIDHPAARPVDDIVALPRFGREGAAHRRALRRPQEQV